MTNFILRHGEVLLKQIATLPEEAKLEKVVKNYIVAHSETGHHHVLESQHDFKVYTWNGETYLEVPEIAELFHQKTGADVHTPHKVIPGFYKVNIKKHFDYFKGILERVRD
jgi:hypothetical protein